MNEYKQMKVYNEYINVDKLTKLPHESNLPANVSRLALGGVWSPATWSQIHQCCTLSSVIFSKCLH